MITPLDVSLSRMHLRLEPRTPQLPSVPAGIAAQDAPPPLYGFELGLGAPLNIDPPQLTQTGSTLTCSDGTWTPTPSECFYAWSVGGVWSEDALTSVYTAQSADAGKLAFCVVSGAGVAGVGIGRSGVTDAASNSVTIA